MARLIAPCGLVCSECEAFVATAANDEAKLLELGTAAAEQLGRPFTVDDAKCVGCTPAGDYRCSYCDECGVRKCALARGVENCGRCEDYGCQTVTAFWEMAPAAHETLEQLRKGNS